MQLYFLLLYGSNVHLFEVVWTVIDIIPEFWDGVECSVRLVQLSILQTQDTFWHQPHQIEKYEGGSRVVSAVEKLWIAHLLVSLLINSTI